MTRLQVYLSYPHDPDVTRLAAALGQDADAVDLIAGPGYQDVPDVRTRKRAATFSGTDGEPELTAEHFEAYGRAEVLVALDVPHRLAELSPHLRWIQACGAGVGQFGEATLGARGVTLTSAQGIGAPPIAEFVIGRLLELYKRFRDLDVLQQERRWEFTPGESLGGRTMVIVGLGAIGTEVAVRARAFGVRTIGVRRSYVAGATSPVVDVLCGPDQLDDVLPEADIVVLAAPETPETRGLFDAATLARMRPGAVLCNVARGSLVVESALVDAVVSGHLRAAILDVVAEEPLPDDSPLWASEGIVLSPHSSTSPDGYFDRLLDLVAANVRRFLAGEPLANVVDLDLVGR